MRNHMMLGLGLLFVLQGCAYQQAMKRGRTAAGAQEWEQAVDAYRFADALKPGTAEEELRQARTRMVELELAAAEAALQGKDFTAVDAHLRRAEEQERGHPRVEEVRQGAREAMVAELQRRMEAGEEVRPTYQFGVLAKRLHPTAPEVEDATSELREQIVGEVRRLVDEAAYEEARALARTIVEIEPEQATRSRRLEAEATDAWVAALLKDAQAAERYRPGLAAVHYARAFEVGGDEAHREASQAALEAASSGAAIAVFVDTQGEGGRHWGLRKALRETLDSSPGVKRGWSSSWDLQAVVAANNARCQESKEAKPLEKEFVAGQRQVPNPAFAEVTEALAKAEEALAEAEAELGREQESLQEVQSELAAREEDRDGKKKAHDQAEARLQETRSQLELARARQAEVAGEIASAQEGGDKGGADEAKMRLEVVEGLVAEWEEKEQTDLAAVAEAKKALDTSEAELAPVQAEAERQGERTAAATSKRDAADKAVAELKGKQRDTDETLTEDVLETFKYAETTWTYACEAPATIYFASRWKTDLDRRATIEAKNSTTDLSRPGHEKAEIEEDPKAYPRTHKELVTELDEVAHKAIAEAIEAYLEDGFNRRLDEALAATEDVGKATHALMGIYAGAPERVDNPRRERLAEHLKERYGIEDPAILGVQAAEEPPEEAGAEAEAGSGATEGAEEPAEAQVSAAQKPGDPEEE